MPGILFTESTKRAKDFRKRVFRRKPFYVQLSANYEFPFLSFTKRTLNILSNSTKTDENDYKSGNLWAMLKEFCETGVGMIMELLLKRMEIQDNTISFL